jgi:hypothetical protein
MDSGSIAALAAISGSMVGAFSSIFSTWMTQIHQDRRDLLEKQIARREALYSEFISETARVLIDATEHNLTDAENLIPAYALLSRIRLISSPRVLAAAEEVVKAIVETYARPNLTPEKIPQAMAVSGGDPLKEFSAVCRAELGLMHRSTGSWRRRPG